MNTTRHPHIFATLAALLCLTAPARAEAIEGFGLLDHDERGAPAGSVLGVNIGLGTLIHPEVAQRDSGVLFALNADWSSWVAETAYGSLIGLELQGGILIGNDGGNEGEANVLSPSLRALATWAPVVPFDGDFTTPLILIAGANITGYDDVWWEPGGRLMGHVGVRLVNLIDYHYVRPLALVQDHPTLGPIDRTEHHFQLRSVTDFGESGFTFSARYELGVSQPRTGDVLHDGRLVVTVGGAFF